MITESDVRQKMSKSFCNKINFGDVNECWEWNGALSRGYGRLGFLDENRVKHSLRAHRYLYIQLFGSIKDEIKVCHNCPNGDNPKCCNPNHLWAGTQKENVADRDNKGRRADTRGSKHPMAKLNEEQVRLIKERLAVNDQMTKLATHFNVSNAVIFAIKCGRNWSYLS